MCREHILQILFFIALLLLFKPISFQVLITNPLYKPKRKTSLKYITIFCENSII